MNVSNLNTYHNSIYTAVIVEVDEDNKIYQVYIPAIHASLKTAFEAYVQDSNKSQSTYRSYFPWASSLIEELEIGTMVYITFVNNDISNILIIGVNILNISVSRPLINCKIGDNALLKTENN